MNFPHIGHSISVSTALSSPFDIFSALSFLNSSHFTESHLAFFLPSVANLIPLSPVRTFDNMPICAAVFSLVKIVLVMPTVKTSALCL